MKGQAPVPKVGASDASEEPKVESEGGPNIRSTAGPKIRSTAGPKVAAPAPAPVTPHVLGAAAGYAVLGASTVTNDGKTTITGFLGVSPGTAITGMGPPTKVNGETHAGDSHAAAAQKDVTKAMTYLKGLTGAKDMTGKNLNGLTLKAGVYKYSSSADLSVRGVLTLDGENKVDAKWVFQIGSTLVSNVGTKVKMINGGDPMNVYWNVGSSATLGTSCVMVGNIVAYASITLGTGASLRGRALARVAAVTMLGNAVDAS